MLKSDIGISRTNDPVCMRSNTFILYFTAYLGVLSASVSGFDDTKLVSFE